MILKIFLPYIFYLIANVQGIPVVSLSERLTTIGIFSDLHHFLRVYVAWLQMEGFRHTPFYWRCEEACTVPILCLFPRRFFFFFLN